MWPVKHHINEPLCAHFSCAFDHLTILLYQDLIRWGDKNGHRSATLTACSGVFRVNSGKRDSRCHSLMSCNVLKASLHIIVTLKKTLQGISLNNLSLLVQWRQAVHTWLPLDAAMLLWWNKPQAWMSLFERTKGSPLNPDTPFSCSLQFSWENMLHSRQQQSQCRTAVIVF